MGAQQEAAVRSLLDSVVARDREGFVHHFDNQAVYHVNAWHDPIVGHDGLRAEFERQAGIYTDFRYEILHILSTDALVFTERIDTMQIAGTPVSLHWASVHELAPTGKITAARDYYDMQELEARLTSGA
jgi:limonene-1,2-epoxide hydrolase